MPTEARYTIAEASKMVQVTPKTLRQWEAKGKISPPARDRNNTRFYRSGDIERAIGYRDGPPPQKKPKRKR